jgi:hypothetical protein
MHADPVALIFGHTRSSGYPDERAPDIVCGGVPTDSVLGLLCALGTLRTLHRAWPGDDVRMAWRRKQGAWRPCIWAKEGRILGDEAERQDRIVKALAGSLTPAEAAWWAAADDPKMPAGTFRAKAREALDPKAGESREYADWLAAYGCEVFAEADGDDIQDSDLSTMRRASQQLLLKSLRELAGCTEEHHLHQALFGPWTYRDPKPYLRLDPRDDRSSAAYRAFDPQDRDGRDATSPILTVRGANRLAAEALVMFPTAPLSRTITTTSFTRIEGEDYFRFPLWDRSLTLAGVGAMLAHPDLLAPQPPADRLRAIRVTAVLQARRNQTDKGARSFLPVEQVW